MILLNATNTTPGTAADLREGMLFVKATDEGLTIDGAVHGYRVKRTWKHSNPEMIMLQDDVYSTRSLPKDTPVLIWIPGTPVAAGSVSSRAAERPAETPNRDVMYLPL